MRRTYLTALLLFGLCVFPRQGVCGSIFDEEFSNPTLDPAWQVTSGPGSYSLTVDPGYLRYNLVGPQSTAGGWRGGPSGVWTPSLSLARPFAGNDWTLEAQVTYDIDWTAYSGAQRPYLFVSFGSGVDEYLAIDRGTDPYYNSNQLEAELFSGGSLVASDYTMLDPTDVLSGGTLAPHTYWFQVQRQGSNVTLRYSFDGVTFLTALSGSIAASAGPTQQVILAGTTYSSVGSFADYNYIRADTGTPEPATFLLVGLVLAGAALRRRLA